uniref:Uncharacterized protein n=1 Tax=Salix viminalis TaxID=40686 RepID=A0A6N2LGW3_SALVM
MANPSAPPALIQRGLVEKDILNYDFDLVASDHSDANTNSTTLFSDDTNDWSRRSTNPEIGMYRDKYRPDVPGISDHRTGHLSSSVKKSELKIGESSAFFTYIKSGTVKNNSQGVALIDDNINQNSRMEEKLQQLVNDTHLQENGKTLDYYSQGDDFRCSTSVPDSLSVWKDLAPLLCQEDGVHMHQINVPQLDASSLTTQIQLHQKNLHELQSHGTLAMLPRYSHLPQCPPHISGMKPFPYYPVSICLQPGQMLPPHHDHHLELQRHLM